MTGGPVERIADAVERIAVALERANAMTAAAVEAAADVPCPRCNGQGWLGHPTNPCSTCDGLGRLREDG